MSVKDNLEFIRRNGITRFVQRHYEKYRCPECSGMISIHNGKCFHCEPITRLIDKRRPGLRKPSVRGVRNRATNRRKTG